MAKKGFTVLKIILCTILALVLGTGITAVSAFMPVFLEQAEDFYVINYGFPIAFVEQTTNIVPNPSYFPMYFTPKYQHESFETEIMVEPLVFSVVLNVLICGAVVFLVWILHRIYRKKHPKKAKVNKRDLYKPVFSDNVDISVTESK